MTSLFDGFLEFDLRVFQWVANLYNPILDKIMVLITYSGEAGAIFILISAILFFNKKYRKIGFCMLVSMLIMLVLNNFVLKEIFERARPFNLELTWWVEEYIYPNLVSEPTSFSFPSGHTSSAFAAAIACLWYNRKIGIPVTIFAFIMGFSRIYVGVHYFSDVAFGVLVGIIYALLGVLVTKYCFEKFNNKVFERKQNSKKEL
ncbi:MAG: phosphatase PAP2 family protein [Clostridia bacterium]